MIPTGNLEGNFDSLWVVIFFIHFLKHRWIKYNTPAFSYCLESTRLSVSFSHLPHRSGCSFTQKWHPALSFLGDKARTPPSQFALETGIITLENSRGEHYYFSYQVCGLERRSTEEWRQHQVGARGRGRATQESLRHFKEQLREQLDISSWNGSPNNEALG